MTSYAIPARSFGVPSAGRGALERLRGRRSRPAEQALTEPVPGAALTPASGGAPAQSDVLAMPLEATGEPTPAVSTAAAVQAAWTPPSWEDIVREHGARVYRLAYRLTGNQHDAEDLTQEVFVRVFRSLNSYTPGTFEGWLHRITTNLFLDNVRRKQRIRFDALPEDAGDRLAGNDPGPERSWEMNNLDHDVQAALDTLPPDFRAAVVLCDIEGLSYEEIAATLDIKLGTVRSRIHRGRALLRESLAHRSTGRQGAQPGDERRGQVAVSAR